jgi:hypothetical protein
VHFVTNVSLLLGISIKRGFFIPIMTIFNKKNPDLLGLCLKFEVVCAFSFWANVCEILDFGVLDPNLNITDS